MFHSWPVRPVMLSRLPREMLTAEAESVPPAPIVKLKVSKKELGAPLWLKK